MKVKLTKLFHPNISKLTTENGGRGTHFAKFLISPFQWGLTHSALKTVKKAVKSTVKQAVKSNSQQLMKTVKTGLKSTPPAFIDSTTVETF